MTWLTATLAALAIYRVARMVAEEDGPAFVFKRLRERYTDQHSSIALGLRCPYCIGFWAALPVTIMLCMFGDWPIALWPLWWFGLAGAAAKIHEYWKMR
jgi:hypothetical protein